MTRLIAYYLPQFHPIPENDVWWEKGFTEWTNATKATPMFPGHHEPLLPADLGFYDLRVPETRLAQAELARDYGIEAFCYYHYWFAGRRLLERPFHDVLASGQPDFPFCLCWANQTWTGIWHGAPDRVLVEQTYPGLDDHRAHFETLLPAFRDPRYVTVDGCPLMLIYRPLEVPDIVNAAQFWREMAHRAGLKGLHLVGVRGADDWRPHELGLDASTTTRLPPRRSWVSRRKPIQWLRAASEKRRGLPTIYRYEDILPQLAPKTPVEATEYPTAIPNWDNTPRSGKDGLVLHGASPEQFRKHLRTVIGSVRGRQEEHNLIFIKSWNEWAEGNHLEPDRRFGRQYLEVIRDECGLPPRGPA